MVELEVGSVVCDACDRGAVFDGVCGVQEARGGEACYGGVDLVADDVAARSHFLI